MASHISLSQRPDPKEKQVISLDQDVRVCGYFFWWMVDETPLYDFSLPCNIFGMGYIFLTHLVGVWHTFFGYASFLSFFFFDMPCGHVAYLLWVCIFSFFLTRLVGMWHTFFGYASFISSSFFCIAHILDGHFREKDSWYVMEFYFVGG